jgi:hypothetical protein
MLAAGQAGGPQRSGRRCQTRSAGQLSVNWGSPALRPGLTHGGSGLVSGGRDRMSPGRRPDRPSAAGRMPVPIGEPLPVPTRTRAGSAKATDVGTRQWCPLPCRARAAEVPPEMGHRPRAWAARHGPAGDSSWCRQRPVNVPDRPARVMRPAGGLFAPGVHPGPDEVGHPALRAAACAPMSPWGGPAAAKRYRRGEKGLSPPGWAHRPGHSGGGPGLAAPHGPCAAGLGLDATRPWHARRRAPSRVPPRHAAPRRTGRSGCCHGTTTAPRIFDARTIRT